MYVIRMQNYSVTNVLITQESSYLWLECWMAGLKTMLMQLTRTRSICRDSYGTEIVALGVTVMYVRTNRRTDQMAAN
jgi:hypothetical protein